MVSTHPVVVFASLAAFAVTGFSDICRVVITEVITDGDDVTHHIQRPHIVVDGPVQALIATVRPVSGGGGTVSGRTVLTAILAPPVGAEPGYHGTVVYFWRDDYQPTELDVVSARLGVDRAVAAVTAARLTVAAHAHGLTAPAPRRHRNRAKPGRAVHTGTARALAVAAELRRTPRGS